MFKVGDIVVCTNLKYKEFYKSGYFRESNPIKYIMSDIKTLTLGKKYEFLNIPEISNSITIINDNGNKISYSSKRFKGVNKFRKFKLNKIVKNIQNDNKR